jgi:Lrp/AsnC family transcriptional regulator
MVLRPAHVPVTPGLGIDTNRAASHCFAQTIPTPIAEACQMNDSTVKIDAFDMKILSAMQNDATLSQRDLAEKIGLSQNACWRRLQRLHSLGLIRGSHSDIDLNALGFDLTVFVMIRTRHHSKEWSEGFRAHVERLPEVIDFYRIGGDWDYLIKVVTKGMSGYDAFYQKLITNFDLATVTGFFSMEAIINNRPVDLTRLR